jgi:O-antigen ligase
MPDTVTNTGANLRPSPGLAKISLGTIAWFSLLILVGALAIVQPLILLVCVGVVIAVGLFRVALVSVRRAGLELWQVFALISVSGYLLLNYGFENLAIHLGGFPIIISYGLMFASLALGGYAHRHLMARAMQEPAVQCMLALLGLSVFHLALNVPSYGLMAVRDASMCVDGVFMFLGLLWAMKRNSVIFLTKWMTVVFVLNLFYGLTRPLGEGFWSWSPQSGVFLKVPIFGSFNGTGDLLLAGALFCICVGAYVIRRPSWAMVLLAVAQFLGFAIFQVRRMYIGAVAVFVILILLGESKKFAKLLVLLPASVAVLLLASSLGGFEIPGRMGPVNLEFFEEHIRSLSTSEGTPGSSVESRFSMAEEAFQHFLAHPVVGEGFGLPLISEVDKNQDQGAITRVPHNSSLTYLARLGVIGFAVWIAFHFCIISRFVYGLRLRRTSGDNRLSGFVLWLFLFYVLFMIGSLVEAAFEFPSGAVPFYFLMGLALGLIRWQLPQKAKTDLRLVPIGSNAMRA